MSKKLKILAAGDLHGDVNLAKRLSEKAKKGKADLIVLAGDINGRIEGDGKILESFVKAKQKVLFVSGNWDSGKENELMKERAKCLHHYYVTYGDTAIAGIGNHDWKGEFNYEDFQIIKNNFKKMKPKKKILVSHLHARGTLAEFSGFEGDKILRKAIDELKPDILISAHIHEAEGIEDKIGKTKIVQVGRNGTMIEI